jgi:hypothetical protein
MPSLTVPLINEKRLNQRQIQEILRPKKNSGTHLALVRATFVLWLSERNPILPFELDLTVDSMIMSSSSPWYPSIDITRTSKLRELSYFVPILALIAFT